MKKQFIAGIVIGGLAFGTAGVFAGQYMATDNPFPIQLNGVNVSLTGYNINDETYFKLRDIADVVGGFTVGFENNTIQLSKDGYSYQTAQTDAEATERPSKVATPSGTPQPFTPSTIAPINDSIEIASESFTTHYYYSGELMNTTNVTSFKVLDVEHLSTGSIKLDFEVIGTSTGYLEQCCFQVVCYDSEGYNVGTKDFHEDVSISETYKLTESMYLPAGTSRIEFKDIVI